MPKAALAKRCLRVIDTLRDEHGIAANDSRHPDVQSGKPWVEEALPFLMTVRVVKHFESVKYWLVDGRDKAGHDFACFALP